ncbi:MAG: Lar family restriction alleviation protein [Sulfuricella sp.]
MPIIVSDCVFCGSPNVEIYEVGLNEFAVNCEECRCIGPIQDTVMEAISYWNDRRGIATEKPKAA